MVRKNTKSFRLYLLTIGVVALGLAAGLAVGSNSASATATDNKQIACPCIPAD
jgi:hypothetical protein